MRIRTLPTLIVPVALLVGCSAPPPAAIPVTSPRGDLPALTGDWQGEFWSSETRRHGHISFHLAAGADSATGQVLMYLRNPSQPLWQGGGPSPNVSPSEAVEGLSLKFVNVEGGFLSGEMEPYTDPMCACLVRTTFLGRIDGKRLEGTYTTRGTGREYESGGRWSAERK